MAKKRAAASTVMEEMNNVPVDSLVSYPNNPRNNENTIDAVKKSLQRFGYVKVSIGIDEKNVLLYGHTTLKAIKELGWPTVPKVSRIVGLDEKHKRAYRIADNRLSEMSYWDSDLLMSEMSFLKEQDFNIEDMGFSEMDLKDLTDKVDDKPQKAVKTMNLRTGPKYLCPHCGYEMNPVEKPKKGD